MNCVNPVKLNILTLVLFLTAAISGCGSDSSEGTKSSADTTSNPQMISTTDLDITLDELTEDNRLSASERRVYQRVQNHETVDFDELTTAIRDLHLRNKVSINSSPARGRSGSARTRAEARRTLRATSLNESLDSLIGEMRNNATVQNGSLSLKAAYETKLESPPGRPIRYNSSALNAFDLLDRHELQCFSGTVFHQIVSRAVRGAERFSANDPIVIFKSGHVLPGFLKRDGSGRLHLYGEETTYRGAGLIYFGLVAHLTGVRLVLPSDFLISEVLRDSIANPRAFVASALQRAAHRYQFNLDTLSTGVPTTTDQALRRRRNQALNQSLFSFGESQRGRHDRQAVETSSATGGAFVAPEALAQVTAPAPVEIVGGFGSNEEIFLDDEIPPGYGYQGQCPRRLQGHVRIGPNQLIFSPARFLSGQVFHTWDQFIEYFRHQCQEFGPQWDFLALKKGIQSCRWNFYSRNILGNQPWSETSSRDANGIRTVESPEALRTLNNGQPSPDMPLDMVCISR